MQRAVCSMHHAPIATTPILCYCTLALFVLSKACTEGSSALSMPELAASEGQTLRAQSKKAKQQGQAQSRADNTGNSNREVIKPVLANPLTVPW